MPRNLPTSYIVPTRPVISNEPITAIILAANIGYGMKSYGPKTLLNINNKSLLEYQTELLRKIFPQLDIILVVGFFADRIIRKCPKSIRIVENQLYESTNETQQLKLALNCTLTDNVLIIKDNIIFNEETLKAITKDKSCIIYDSQKQIDSGDIGINIVDGFVTTFTYDSMIKWCHIAYITGRELKIIRNLCNNKDNAQKYLFEILDIMLHKIDKIKAIEPQNMEIIRINSFRDLERL